MVSLSYNQLAATIPVEVMHAAYLERLYLNHNNFEGPVPPELAATNLRELDLAYNKFQGTLPGEMLMRLTNMVFLSFDSNPLLTGTMPSEFGVFNELQFLSISNTTIRPPIPTQYGFLTKLTDLRIADTKHSDRHDGAEAGNYDDYRIPTVLGNLRDLRVLLLNDVGLTGVIPSELGLLTKLGKWRNFLMDYIVVFH